MDDLVKRLRVDVFYGDERLHKMSKHNPLHMEAADRIEALEARIAKADALADTCHELSREAYGYDHLYETTFHRDVHEKLEKALAAYRESDT